MAEKISTLILTVDLDCYICSKKIKKTICKLQGREQIQAFNFDEKNNTVTISGLFDPQKLKKKLFCKASCKVIKDIKIKEDDKKPAEKIITTQPDKEKEKAKAKPAESEKEKAKAKPAESEKEKAPAKAAKPAEAEKEKEKAQAKAAKPAEAEKEKEKAQPKAAKPAEAEKKGKAKPAETEKEKAKPAETEKEKEKANNKPAEPEKEKAWAVGPPLPSCCWRPLYEQYYGGCRCCSCGMFFAWPAPPLPPAGVYMGGPPTSTCQFFCEEDPSCTIM